MLKVVCLVEHTYVGEVLIQIWLKSTQKMSKLLDKQVYVLNKCFKYKFQDSHRCNASPRKVYDENKRKKQRKEKNNDYIKISLMTGRTSYDCCRS